MEGVTQGVTPQSVLEEAKSLQASNCDSQKVLQLFQQAANLGNPEASFHAGLLMVKLIDESSITDREKDYQLSEAQKYFLMGVNKTNGVAEGFLGKMYEGVDPKRAMSFYEAGAKQGNVEVKYLLALMYLKRRNEVKKDIFQAILYLEEAVRNKIPNATMFLINAYLLSKSPENKEKALQLSIKKADKGNKRACAIAGKLLLTLRSESTLDVEKGFKYLNSVKKEFKLDVQIIFANYYYSQRTNERAKKAITLYKKILKNPSIRTSEKSQIHFRIAKIYLGELKVGILITNLAIHHLQEASKEGGEASIWLRLGEQYLKKGSANYKLAFEAFSKASDLGSLFGSYHLGKCYRYGFGVKKNKGEAFRLNTIALEGGITLAKHLSGLDYLYGQGVQVDYLKAKECLLHCKWKGAAFHLGLIARIEGDQTHALQYFQKGHENGDIKATMHLANMYKTGNGVSKNGELSLKYFICAENRKNGEGICK